MEMNDEKSRVMQSVEDMACISGEKGLTCILSADGWGTPQLSRHRTIYRLQKKIPPKKSLGLIGKPPLFTRDDRKLIPV